MMHARTYIGPAANEIHSDMMGGWLARRVLYETATDVHAQTVKAGKA